MNYSPLQDPKRYMQEDWAKLTPAQRAELYASMVREMTAPFDGMVDRTFYTPPLSVTTPWMKELVDQDNAKNT
jgi:hypothetical protein